MHVDSIKIITQIDDKAWSRCLDTIRNRCNSDPLIENYLKIVPKNYYHFVAAVYADQIISFGAIEHSPQKWGPYIARVLTRFWIHPDFRTHSLTKWGAGNIRFSPIILKPQLEFLKSQNDIKVAMITRQGKYKKSFMEICRLSSEVAADNFEIDDKIYNVCGNSDDESCYQMIALSSINHADKWSILNNAVSSGFFRYNGKKTYAN
jgi:hypothetical protein